MRILIIEDKAKHILSAEKFAKECGHEVVIATSYDDAEKLLCSNNEEYDNDNRFGRRAFVHTFDVVLTDLLLPVSVTGQSNRDISGEMPYGLSLIILAMRTGVKKIGLLTDGGHHDHPFIWALDPLGGYDGKPFTIGDITVMCSSNGPIFHKKYSWEEDLPNHVQAGDPLEGAKDWMTFFMRLMNAVELI